MAFSPPKIGRLRSSDVHRSETSIYRKKIDTPKVYVGNVGMRHWGRQPKAQVCWVTKVKVRDRIKGDSTEIGFKVAKIGVFARAKPSETLEKEGKKRTAPSVPKWSPTSVLTGPDQA